MRLDRFVREEHSEGVKISARVEWEGAHRGPEVMWFESDRRHAEGFDAAPEAFLLAAMPLAAGLGEPRLRIEGRACARLRDGLSAVMTTFATWYPWCRRVPIEASEGFASLSPRTPARVGAFFSGGVDSLSMVVANLRDHGPDDPARVHEAFHLFGWHSDDFDGRSPRAERVRVFEERHARLVTFAERAGLVLTPVRTNVRTFHPSFPWSRDVGFGPGMIAAAHAFRARVSAVLFASGGYPGAMPPHASHPDLDSLFSSGALAASHAEPDHTRLDKVIAIASRPEAMSVLEVCLHHDVPAPGTLALLAAGLAALGGMRSRRTA